MISIIVPCYNVGPYLEETLQSVLDQTYKTWECIVVNDGSPDNTRDIGLAWEAKDKRFIYLELKNGGVERARNKGIERAEGEFILPLDGDDKLASSFLEKTLQVFKDQPDTMLVYTLVELFEAQQGLFALNSFSLENLAIRNMIVCTALYRKTEWERTGGYDEMVKYHWEDWEHWINMLKDGGKVVLINEALFYYRIRSGSGLGGLTPEKMLYMNRYITTKHREFYNKYLGDPLTLYWQHQHTKESMSKVLQELSLRNRFKRFTRTPFKSIKNIAKGLLKGKN